jgi:hypothetical protein
VGARRLGSRNVLCDLRLTSTKCGMTKTDPECSESLEAALTATRCADLRHGPNAPYVRGCVCSECREHECVRIARTAVGSSHSVSYRYS